MIRISVYKSSKKLYGRIFGDEDTAAAYLYGVIDIIGEATSGALKEYSFQEIRNELYVLQNHNEGNTPIEISDGTEYRILIYNTESCFQDPEI